MATEHHVSAASVGAIIVTCNRPRQAASAVQAVLAQTVPPDVVVVVDNGDKSLFVPALSGSDRRVEVFQMPDNVGYGAGIAAGMAYLKSRSSDFYWILDDDSTPEIDALETLLDAPWNEVGIGIAGYSGGIVDKIGRLRHRSPESMPLVASYSRYREADFCLIDGALVPTECVEEVGPTRSDLFMMAEDFEFSTRIRRQMGRRVVVYSEDKIERGHLGSKSSSASSEWRSYYQSRNLLRIALERRDGRAILGHFAREIGFMLHGIARLRFRYVGLRIRGLLDAFIGRMGRTVEPGDY